MADDGARDLFAVFISNDSKQVSFFSLSSSIDLNILVPLSRSSLALKIVVVHQSGYFAIDLVPTFSRA